MSNSEKFVVAYYGAPLEDPRSCIYKRFAGYLTITGVETQNLDEAYACSIESAEQLAHNMRRCVDGGFVVIALDDARKGAAIARYANG